MTWYRKPKRNDAPVDTPMPCYRCGRADGTSPIEIVSAPAPDGPGRVTMWVCEDCRALPGDDASVN